MAVNIRGRSFLKLLDYTPAEIRYLLDLSRNFKDMKRALDSARQLGNIVGGKNAKEEHRRTADEGDAQAVPKGIPVHK